MDISALAVPALAQLAIATALVKMLHF